MKNILMILIPFLFAGCCDLGLNKITVCNDCKTIEAYDHTIDVLEKALAKETNQEEREWLYIQIINLNHSKLMFAQKCLWKNDAEINVIKQWAKKIDWEALKEFYDKNGYPEY